MNGLPYNFLLEVVFRCVVMYVVALLVLRIAGRRGVKQLSVFELIIILTLGSAAGDPLFYEDVGLLPAIASFLVILSLYRLTTSLVSNSEKVERFLEGSPIYLIEDGEFSISNFKKESIAFDEFFSELRVRGISQLGQVDFAILETSGDLSVFFFEEDKIKFGLPIMPHILCKHVKVLNPYVRYACRCCGHVLQEGISGEEVVCVRCKSSDWLIASNERRCS